jgi:hypothetical protein
VQVGYHELAGADTFKVNPLIWKTKGVIKSKLSENLRQNQLSSSQYKFS